MKKSLAHLPENKRDELKTLKTLIVEKIDAEFVILFGSYARGDWVEDKYVGKDGILYDYMSDFDILIVVKDLPKYEYKGYRKRIKNKARRAGVHTRISIIMHSVEEFEGAVTRGQYFFADIIKEGILLHSSERFSLPVTRKPNPKERKNRAEKDFKDWFESAKEFFIDFENAFNRESYKNSVFNLHQATERFYHTVLLVFTGYKPKLHDLEELGIKVNRLSSEFKNIFPKTTAEEKHLFDLLRRAYTEARYDMSYSITKEELEYLAERVKLLQSTTESVCKEKIKSLSALIT
jgi:HEPN domain-containing protein/predicted nucleotidyltransferase